MARLNPGRLAAAVAALGLVLTAWAHAGAADVVVKLHPVSDKGVDEKAEMGTATLSEPARGGVGVTVVVSGLLQGEHFIDFHEGGSCAAGSMDGKTVAAGAAGGIFLPKGASVVQSGNFQAFTKNRVNMNVGSDGTGTIMYFVNGVTRDQLAGRTIVIKGGGDEGTRVLEPMVVLRGAKACGVIPKQS
jgi:Cu-Zn family superoxide dismutase